MTKRNTVATCKNCPHSHNYGDLNAIGGAVTRYKCKRYPDEIAKHPDDWCGEHPDILDNDDRV